MTSQSFNWTGKKSLPKLSGIPFFAFWQNVVSKSRCSRAPGAQVACKSIHTYLGREHPGTQTFRDHLSPLGRAPSSFLPIQNSASFQKVAVALSPRWVYLVVKRLCRANLLSWMLSAPQGRGFLLWTSHPILSTLTCV